MLIWLRHLELDKGKQRVNITVKVVDIFGNDTMTIVDVAVGAKTGTTK